jgi:hypothetical protein
VLPTMVSTQVSLFQSSQVSPMHFVFLHVLCLLQVITKAFTKTTVKISHNLKGQLEGAHLLIVTGVVVPPFGHNHYTRVNVHYISIFYLLVTCVMFTNIPVSIPIIVSYIHVCPFTQSYVGYCLRSLWCLNLHRCDYTDKIKYWRANSNVFESKYF